MKALILKDLYMFFKYCRSYIILILIFTILSFFETDMFIMFYPTMLCGMIPVTLLGYDERSKWLIYSQTMPYKKSEIVHSKYVLGLTAQLIMLFITAIAQAIRLNVNNSFILENYIIIIVLLLIMSLISSSISLPFIFKYGVEKGRIIYYIMVGLISAGSILLSGIATEISEIKVDLVSILPILFIIGVGIYSLSWFLSVVFYKKREL